MSEIQLRKLTLKDKTQFLKLLSDRQVESNELHGGSVNPVVSEGEKIFDEMMAQDWITIIVAEVEQKLVATVTIYLLPRIRTGGNVAIFEDVLVAKEMRGQGVGKQLMQYAIEQCRQNKTIKKIKLGSRKDELGIHEFYGKLGFSYQEKLLQLSLK